MTRPQRSARSRDRGSLRGSTHVRLRVGLLAIAMLLSLFGARLFQLQGVDSKAYASRAEAAGLVNIALPATRGRILDRNGAPLAESVAGMMVVADPTRTTPNAEAIAKILADRLAPRLLRPAGQADREERQPGDEVPRGSRRFVYVARRVPSTLASSVMDDPQGARLRRESTPVPTRCAPIPAGDVAANLIGFLGNDRPRSPAASSAASTTCSPARTARRPTRSAAATGSRSATTPRSSRSTART